MHFSSNLIWNGIQGELIEFHLNNTCSRLDLGSNIQRITPLLRFPGSASALTSSHLPVSLQQQHRLPWVGCFPWCLGRGNVCLGWFTASPHTGHPASLNLTAYAWWSIMCEHFQLWTEGVMSDNKTAPLTKKQGPECREKQKCGVTCWERAALWTSMRALIP